MRNCVCLYGTHKYTYIIHSEIERERKKKKKGGRERKTARDPEGGEKEG